MKEMLHSKVLVGFILFVLGFTYLNSIQINHLKEEKNMDEILYFP